MPRSTLGVTVNAEKSRLDAVISVRSPEGIILTAQLADPIQRLWALLIDIIVIALLLFVFGILFVLLGGRTAVGLFFLCAFLLIWGYFFISEAFFHGQTLGKRCCQITVVSTDLTAVSVSAALWRNVLRYIDFLPGCFGLGMVFILCSEKNQRLGDWMAGTVVIMKEVPIMTKALTLAVPALPVPFALNFTERLALVEFARYSTICSQERAEEIATPFAYPQEHPSQTVIRLQGYARFLTEGDLR